MIPPGLKAGATGGTTAAVVAAAAAEGAAARAPALLLGRAGGREAAAPAPELGDSERRGRFGEGSPAAGAGAQASGAATSSLWRRAGPAVPGEPGGLNLMLTPPLTVLEIRWDTAAGGAARAA